MEKSSFLKKLEEQKNQSKFPYIWQTWLKLFLIKTFHLPQNLEIRSTTDIKGGCLNSHTPKVFFTETIIRAFIDHQDSSDEDMQDEEGMNFVGE